MDCLFSKYSQYMDGTDFSFWAANNEYTDGRVSVHVFVRHFSATRRVVLSMLTKRTTQTELVKVRLQG